MSDPISSPIVALTDVRFGWRPDAPPVLDIATLSIARGERLLLGGPSGSGKSTLLALIAGVLRASHGSVRVLGRDLGTLSGAGRDRFRADHTGVVFQMFNLLPYLSVLENVCLPCAFSAERRRRCEAGGQRVASVARDLLSQLGLEGDAVLRRPVTELSVGQQQRVAAARALIGSPELIIADEPTSALDADRRAHFLGLLFRECTRAEATLLFVTHDATLAPLFDRSVELASLRPANGTRVGAGGA